MNPIVTAAIANQRHATLVAEADAHRQARAARASRPTRVRSGRTSARTNVFRRPVGAFNTWFAAGQL